MTTTVSRRMSNRLSENITLSKANNIGLNNNTYELPLQVGGIEFDDKTAISVNEVILPNSVCNFSDTYNNNSFGYLINGNISAEFGNAEGGIGVGGGGTIGASGLLTDTHDIFIAIGTVYVGYYINVVSTGVGNCKILEITNNVIAGTKSYTGSMRVKLNKTFRLFSAVAISGITIVGKNIVAVCKDYYSIPQVGMYLPDSVFTVTPYIDIETDKGYENWITAVSRVNALGNDNQFIITLAKEIIYDFRIQSFYSYNKTYIYPVSLGNGYYSITDINNALQSTMKANGHCYYNLYNNAVGTQNETYIYPLGIQASTKNYSFGMTGSGIVDAIETSFGTGANVNTALITNGDFNSNPQASDGYFTVAGSATTGTGVFQWVLTTANGNWLLANGNSTPYFSSAPLGYTQYLISVNASSNTSSTMTQTNYYSPATYSVSFYANQTTAPSITSSFTISFTDGTTTWSAVRSLVLVNNWTLLSASITIPSGSYATSFSITMVDTVSIVSFGVGGVVITSNVNAVGNAWTYGFPPFQKGTPLLLPNIYQSITYDGARWNATNPYCLGNYLMKSFLPEVGLSPSVPYLTAPNYDYGLPAFGLSMNPFYGIIIKCSLTENNLCSQTDIIDAFPMRRSFGSNNVYIGTAHNDIKIRKGRYNYIRFLLCDQNGTPITLLDNNVLFNFKIDRTYKHIYQK